jgi:hypothetical protein
VEVALEESGERITAEGVAKAGSAVKSCFENLSASIAYVILALNEENQWRKGAESGLAVIHLSLCLYELLPEPPPPCPECGGPTGPPPGPPCLKCWQPTPAGGPGASPLGTWDREEPA